MLDELMVENTPILSEEQDNLKIDMEESEKKYLNQMIKTLNGGCDYKLVGILCFNGEIMCVLEIQDNEV